MNNKTISAYITIYNLPEYPLRQYIVANMDGHKLWFFGTYDFETKAEEIAAGLSRGLVIEVAHDTND